MDSCNGLINGRCCLRFLMVETGAVRSMAGSRAGQCGGGLGVEHADPHATLGVT